MHPKPNNGVKIMVRVRPPLPREMAFDTAVEVLSDREIVVYRPEQEFASLYDAVLGEASTQDETYTHVKGEATASCCDCMAACRMSHVTSRPSPLIA